MRRATDCGCWFLSTQPYSSFSPSVSRNRSRRGIGAPSAPSAHSSSRYFTEMYGFPLTIFLLSGWLQTRFPDVDWFAHDSGHLLEMIFGWRANPHFGPFHLLSFAFIIGGFWLLSAAWPILYRAQRSKTLATTGPYARMRHPQYVGFVLIMIGFLFQWPTLVTLIMFPILVFMYWRLALKEERDVEAEFGEAYRQYAADTPRFFPRIRSSSVSVK